MFKKLFFLFYILLSSELFKSLNFTPDGTIKNSNNTIFIYKAINKNYRFKE